MRFLLVSVTDPSPASRANLAALLASVAAQEREVDVVLVLRGGGDVPAGVHPVVVPLATGLSAARNAGLAHAREAGLLDAAGGVGFPDDDCRLGAGVLARVERRLAEAGLVAGPYAPSRAEIDWTRFPRAEQPLTPRLCMKAVSSINVFLRGDVVRAVGDFDERLGLGAEYGASEDADYVLRALALGHAGLWAPDDVFLEHEYKPGVQSRYYLGNVAVLSKHARETPLLLLRCFAYGAKLTLRRTITPREYAHGFAVAVRLLTDRA